MNAIDKAISTFDSSESEDKEIYQILQSAKQDINRVSIQVKKLKQYGVKFKKYEFGYSASVYTDKAADILQDAVYDCLENVERADKQYS